MTIDRVAAFQRERSALLGFCRGLSEAQWHADSAATGWRVQDVVAHLGASCRALFTPTAITLITTRDIERANDIPVDSRRDWPWRRVLADYERWSGHTARAASLVARTPVRALRTRLGQLGWFKVGMVLPGALVFDHHTHLRHDIAPAVGAPPPGTDADRMSVVIEWMLAVLANQLQAAQPSWLRAPVCLELHGQGGGRWLVHPDGRISAAGADCVPVASIRCDVSSFPTWATKRVDWRTSDVALSGDREPLITLLDSINII